MDYREQAKELLQVIVGSTREFREQTKEDVPQSFILLVPTEGHLEGVMLPWDTLPPAVAWNKNAVAEFVKAAAKKLGALYVIFITEAWAKKLDGDAELSAVAAMSAYGGIKEMDGSREIIFINIDGPDLRMTYMIEIHADGSLGPTEEQSDGTTEGRFTNLSGRADDN